MDAVITRKPAFVNEILYERFGRWKKDHYTNKNLLPAAYAPLSGGL